MRRTFTISILFVIIAGITVIGAAINVGDRLSRPAHRSVGIAPADLPAESIILYRATNEATESAESVSGWLAYGTPGMGVVLLLHGVRSDRRQMLGRARFLFQAGYSVMLIDLPAHGESSGDRITVGYREAEGVKAALHHLATTFPDEKIAVIGVSLGAAAFMLSKVASFPDAVVLESMYPTIEEAITRRLQQRIGPLGSLLTPLFSWQLLLRLGIPVEQLRPIAELPTLHSPVLIMSGREDRHTSLSDTQRLFEAANQPKELWIVTSAAHVDLHAFNPEEYEARVSTFLHKYLQGRDCAAKQLGSDCLAQE